MYCGDISADGTLVIDQLSPDETHRVRIEAERYRTFETDLTVTTEQPTLLRARLEAIIEFADNFANLYKWDAPPSWAVENQLLRVSGPTFAVGLPKDVGFRGCEINFDLRIARGWRAAWIVRGRDERNGYLFILEAPTPTTSRLDTYLYRDGNLGTPVQSDPLPLRFEARQWNRIRIVARDNKISHLITPGNSPDEISVALFQDRDKLFPYGAPGFVSLPESTFYVGGFVVCPEGANCRPEIR